MNTREAVLRQIEYQMGIETPSTSMTLEEIGMDSLDRIELFLGIEDSLSIDLPDDDVDRCATVQDIIQVATIARSGV